MSLQGTERKYILRLDFLPRTTELEHVVREPPSEMESHVLLSPHQFVCSTNRRLRGRPHPPSSLLHRTDRLLGANSLRPTPTLGSDLLDLLDHKY